VHRAPGIPCALCFQRTGSPGKTRAARAARSRSRICCCLKVESVGWAKARLSRRAHHVFRKLEMVGTLALCPPYTISPAPVIVSPAPVIPGRRAAANPESITTIGSMDSGLTRSLSSGAHSRDPLARPGMTNTPCGAFVTSPPSPPSRAGAPAAPNRSRAAGVATDPSSARRGRSGSAAGSSRCPR
jgi:hypothetical protein